MHLFGSFILQKAYVGIGVDSIKCIWDQNNDSEMVIDAEVLPILAEDATYRLWEFMNVS